MERGVLSTRDIEWLLSSLCQLHRIPFDAGLLRGQCPPPHNLAQLLKVLDGMGLKAQPARLDAKPLATTALPFIAFEKTRPHPDEDGLAGHPALVTLVLIVQHDKERVLFFPAGSDQPATLPVDKFLDQSKGVSFDLFLRVDNIAPLSLH
jgi:subfamily B ATP-binding cassette protein HlyB/CyaB